MEERRRAASKAFEPDQNRLSRRNERYVIKLVKPGCCHPDWNQRRGPQNDGLVWVYSILSATTTHILPLVSLLTARLKFSAWISFTNT